MVAVGIVGVMVVMVIIAPGKIDLVAGVGIGVEVGGRVGLASGPGILADVVNQIVGRIWRRRIRPWYGEVPADGLVQENEEWKVKGPVVSGRDVGGSNGQKRLRPVVPVILHLVRRPHHTVCMIAGIIHLAASRKGES